MVEAAKSNASAQHGKVGAMYADVKRKTANDKMNYDINNGKLKLDGDKLSLKNIKALTLQQSKKKHRQNKNTKHQTFYKDYKNVGKFSNEPRRRRGMGYVFAWSRIGYIWRHTTKQNGRHSKARG